MQAGAHIDPCCNLTKSTIHITDACHIPTWVKELHEVPSHLQASQQELSEAQATVSRLHADLEDVQQKSAQALDSAQAAMHARADRAQQQLAQVSASLEEARSESEQVKSPPQRRHGLHLGRPKVSGLAGCADV